MVQIGLNCTVARYRGGHILLLVLLYPTQDNDVVIFDAAQVGKPGTNFPCDIVALLVCSFKKKNKLFKTNSTYPFLDGQRSVARDRRRVARDLCPKKYVVGYHQAKQKSESDDVLVVCFSCLRAVALKEFTLVPEGPKA